MWSDLGQTQLSGHRSATRNSSTAEHVCPWHVFVRSGARKGHISTCYLLPVQRSKEVWNCLHQDAFVILFFGITANLTLQLNSSMHRVHLLYLCKPRCQFIVILFFCCAVMFIFKQQYENLAKLLLAGTADNQLNRCKVRTSKSDKEALD